MHFVLQTDTRSRNKVYSYYICMYLISRGGERMWLLTKEGKTLEESDHVWHVQRSEPAAGSHKISHCGAVTCENPSVAIIKPPKAGETKPGQSPPRSRQQDHHHWLICSQENLDHPCDEVCELWQRRKPLVVHENNGLNPMLRLQDRSFWDHPQGQNVREGQTIVSRSKRTLFYANKASTYQTPNYLITHYTHTVLAGLFIIVDSLKAGVVPGVLEDFHVKRVLNFSSTARTVTSICTWETNEGVKKQVNNERKWVRQQTQQASKCSDFFFFYS